MKRIVLAFCLVLAACSKSSDDNNAPTPVRLRCETEYFHVICDGATATKQYGSCSDGCTPSPDPCADTPTYPASNIDLCNCLGLPCA